MTDIENPMLDAAKKRKRILVAVIVSLCVLYVLLAARPLSREIHFLPVWTIDADNSTRTERLSIQEMKDNAEKLVSEMNKPASVEVSETDSENADSENPENPESNAVSQDGKTSEVDVVSSAKFDGAIPFKLGQLVGYFTKNGRMLSRVTFPFKASVSPSFYSVYETHSEKIEVHSPDGKKIAEINQTGFPYFADDKIFLFLPGGASFARIGSTGEVLWTYEGYSPVTAFSSSKEGLLAGFADGHLISFAPDGSVVFEFEPGGSTYPVILGAGISNSGKLIAAVSGHDNQRFVLAENMGGRAKVIFHKTFSREVTGQMVVKFKNDESAVYYGCSDGLGVVNCKSLKSTVVPLVGTILSIQEDNDGTIFVLSKDGNTYSVSVVEAYDVHSGSFSFEAETAFMSVRDGSLFVGHDSKISRIDIKHK
ncbi:MAG: hypothetical protein K6B43_08160 [Treponema sp.]|nr:hypothetical protein [Treponema sp.]